MTDDPYWISSVMKQLTSSCVALPLAVRMPSGRASFGQGPYQALPKRVPSVHRRSGLVVHAQEVNRAYAAAIQPKLDALDKIRPFLSLEGSVGATWNRRYW